MTFTDLLAETMLAVMIAFCIATVVQSLPPTLDNFLPLTGGCLFLWWTIGCLKDEKKQKKRRVKR